MQTAEAINRGRSVIDHCPRQIYNVRVNIASRQRSPQCIARSDRRQPMQYVEFIAYRRENIPSCLILDVRLRNESGLASQQSIANLARRRGSLTKNIRSRHFSHEVQPFVGLASLATRRYLEWAGLLRAVPPQGRPEAEMAYPQHVHRGPSPRGRAAPFEGSLCRRLTLLDSADVGMQVSN